MEIKNIEVTKILTDSKNKNIHSQDQIKRMAQSIEKVGLINPITVRRDGKNWRITAGECRYKGWEHLFKKDRKKYANIPCILDDETDELPVRMKALDENRVRNTYYTSECMEILQMYEFLIGEGAEHNEVVKKLGSYYKKVQEKIAYARMINHSFSKKQIEAVAKLGGSQLLQRLLPLRIPDQKGNPTSPQGEVKIDYSLCKEAIDEITDKNLRWDKPEFDQVINNLKIKKLEKEQEIDEEKLRVKIEEEFKQKQEKLEEELTDKEELAKKLKELEEKFEDKVEEEKKKIEKEYEEKIGNIQTEINENEQLKEKVEKLELMVLEKNKQISKLIKDTDRTYTQFRSQLDYFLSEKIVTMMSDGEKAKVLANIMDISEKCSIAAQMIRKAKRNESKDLVEV